LTICFRYLVSGKVQGVFYRASTREKARQLNLTGYARNLPDGRVEVVACGEPKALDELRDWLVQGPPASRVSGVSGETAPVQEFAGFTIG
jgi:acylphosphatase